MLEACDAAFGSGNKDVLRTTQANQTRRIKKANHSYAQKIQAHFHNTSDSRSMWEGIQAATD